MRFCTTWEPLFREILEGRRATTAASDPDFMAALFNHRVVLMNLNRRSESAALLREELAMHVSRGELARRDVMEVKWELAKVLSEMGAFDESIELVNSLLVDGQKQFAVGSQEYFSGASGSRVGRLSCRLAVSG